VHRRENEFLKNTEPKILDPIKSDSMILELIENRIKQEAKIQAYKQLPWLSKIFTNPLFFVSIIILPFLASTTSELVNWVVNKTKKEPRIVSVVFFITGLVFMGIIFSISLIAHISAA